MSASNSTLPLYASAHCQAGSQSESTVVIILTGARSGSEGQGGFSGFYTRGQPRVVNVPIQPVEALPALSNFNDSLMPNQKDPTPHCGVDSADAAY
jgi:hypothetical protein